MAWTDNIALYMEISPPYIRRGWAASRRCRQRDYPQSTGTLPSIRSWELCLWYSWPHL